MPPFKTLALIAVIFVGISVGSVSAVDKYCDSTFKSVSAGDVHSLGLLENGTLLSWGQNAEGQLGIGKHIQGENTPQVVLPGSKWIFVATGRMSSYAIKEDGTLWAFGDNQGGQLGDGTHEDRYSPVQIGKDTNWVAISSGEFHVLGLKSDGSLYAWGENNFGQLGAGSKTPSMVPIRIPSSSGKKWIFISAGYYFSFGIQEDGSLWGWGSNEKGQLGDGTKSSKLVPTLFVSKTKVRSVSCGWEHAMALDDKGNLYAWGHNNFGQIGDGTTAEKLVPTPIKPGTTWTSIAGGYGHSMAIAQNGTLFGWGTNPMGQVGSGSKGETILTPTLVDEQLGPWKHIAAGAYHSLGIIEQGLVFSWGRNTDGALGLGTKEEKLTPRICNDFNVCLKGGKCHEKTMQRLLRSFLKW